MSFARIRSLVIVSLLAVCALVVVWVAVSRDTQTRAQASNCRPGAIPVDLSLPENKDVKLHVFNGSGQNGLGAQVSEDFKNRKFAVDPHPGTVPIYRGVALLRYGPKAVSSAWLLRAYFLDQADAENFKGFDPKRKDDVVDVIIGTEYKQLGSPTEVNQSIAQLSNPQLPPGTCAITSK